MSFQWLLQEKALFDAIRFMWIINQELVVSGLVSHDEKLGTHLETIKKEETMKRKEKSFINCRTLLQITPFFS